MNVSLKEAINRLDEIILRPETPVGLAVDLRDIVTLIEMGSALEAKIEKSSTDDNKRIERDGGYAFPLEGHGSGITVRQHYKASALTGLLAKGHDGDLGFYSDRVELVKLAGEIADNAVAEDERMRDQ